MKYIVSVALGLLAAAPSSAVTVSWADLTSYNSTTGVVGGTITTGTGSVGLTVAGGGYSFVELGDPGDTNFWTQPNPNSLPYTGGAVSDAPPTTDIIALEVGGTKTITFSQAVTDPYLALVSWNGNSGVFDQTLTTISSGCGYWGCGTFGDVTDHSFTGEGELHGIIQFHGTFTQVTFTDLTENWHGIQVGIGGIAPPPAVPEPATWAMFIGGFGAIGASLRGRQRNRIAVV